MPTFLRKLFEKYARRLIIGTGEGIKQIPNKDRVKLMANNIYKDFKEVGIPDNMIKTENDIKVFHKQISDIAEKNSKKWWDNRLQKPPESADVLDLTGKKIDTSKPIMGGKNVPETESQIKTKLEGMNKKTIDRIRRRRYQAALKAEREKSAKDPDYLPKVLDPDDFAYGGVAGMLGERTGYESGRRAGPAARQKRKASPTDWYTDKIIADNLGRIKSDMYYKYILPEKQANWMDDITDEDIYGEYDERKGYTSIFKKFFETEEGEKIPIPYAADKDVDVTGLLELFDKIGEGSVSKDHNVEDRKLFDKRFYFDEDKGFVKGVELKGGGIAGMLGEPTYADDNHRVPYGGGGALSGKPPITFTLQGGGSYGSNELLQD